MDEAAKKTTLRMIPYGIYILTADDGKGNVGAATVNWVTQSSCAPPLLVVGVTADSGAHTVVKGTGKFGLTLLGKAGQGAALPFFKPATAAAGQRAEGRGGLAGLGSSAPIAGGECVNPEEDDVTLFGSGIGLVSGAFFVLPFVECGRTQLVNLILR